MARHVCPRSLQKGPPGETPRIVPGAPRGQTGPGETSNMTTVVYFRHPERAGQNPFRPDGDSEAIFRVPPWGPPGALIMTFWVLKWGLLFEALELPWGARK